MAKTEKRIVFTDPVRNESFIRIGIAGPAGAGKTYSSLVIAAGITDCKGIFMIDTEHGSGRLEVGKPDIPPYKHGELLPPYTPERIISACNVAIENGAKLIIIDNLSAVWSGEGGLLEMKDGVAERDPKHDQWAAWRKISPVHDRFFNELLALKCHLICNMRTKTAWDIHTDPETNKKKIVKLGLKPDLREDFDYHFTVVFTMHPISHISECFKDRTNLFDGEEFVPTVETGLKIKEWLEFNMEKFTGASAEKLENIRAEIDLLTTSDEIVQWYKKNQAQLKIELTSNDWDKFIIICKEKKESLAEKLPNEATADDTAAQEETAAAA